MNKVKEKELEVEPIFDDTIHSHQLEYDHLRALIYQLQKWNSLEFEIIRKQLPIIKNVSDEEFTYNTEYVKIKGIKVFSSSGQKKFRELEREIYQDIVEYFGNLMLTDISEL